MKGEGSAVSNPAAGQHPPTIWPLRAAACYVTIAACLPYLTLKVLWLSGDTVGAASVAGAAELVDPRHIVGDLVTAGMEAIAIALVAALTYPWGRRLPGAVVLVPIWLAAGLLAPIALGLPLGLAAQAFVGGSPIPAGNGLDGRVYAVVYGGFIVQAVGLLIAFLGYARRRWPELFWLRTPQLRAVAPRQPRLATIAAAVAAGYGAMLIAWSATGSRWGGPGGFDTVAQKTFLLSTGLIVVGGAAAVLALVRRWGRGRILAPLALAWVGTGVAVASGPTLVALSNHGEASPLLASASLTGALAGLLLARSAIRALAHPPAPDPDRSADRRSGSP